MLIYVTTRDRKLLGLVAHLLGCHELGLRNLRLIQPVYDLSVLDKFLRDIEGLKVPVFVGILPLTSYRNAEFLHNEVPGMRVPEEVRDRMRRAGNGEAARAEGVALAREMLAAVRGRVAGAHIMPPLGKYELALRVIDGLV